MNIPVFSGRRPGWESNQILSLNREIACFPVPVVTAFYANQPCCRCLFPVRTRYQIIPNKFVTAVDQKNSIYNSGVLRAHNERELNDIVQNILNDNDYKQDYLNRQINIANNFFGNYKNSSHEISNEILKLC